MESPFYGNYWSHPTRRVPVNPILQKPVGTKPPAKIVQIPVNYVGSDPNRSNLPLQIQKKLKPDRSDSALKIQKVFRGFLVRRSVKRIESIKQEVYEIERRLWRSETAELIRRDEKERLRISESLMSLLFKLDSVRGVDSGVRNFRKAVIKKAVALQEKVDAIVSGSGHCNDESQIRNDPKPLVEPENQTSEFSDSAENQIESGKLTCQSEDSATLNRSLEIENEPATSFMMNNEKSEIKVEHDVSGSGIGSDLETSVVDNLIEGIDDDIIKAKSRKLEESGEAEKPVDEDVIDDSKRNIELLETMVEKNKKLTNLMTQLFERNEMQTSLLNSLAQRVEQLERAFVCDRLKRKKKKTRHSA